jgi:hypothetical protein
VPRIVLDFDPPHPDAPRFARDTSDLVYFLSWAFSARYGGNHEMSVASLVLRGEYGIDLKPLLTFADRDVEMEADQDMLDRAWQDPGPLEDCCEQVARAFRGDDQRLSAVAAEYQALPELIEELGRIASWAADKGARIRVTFTMDGKG